MAPRALKVSPSRHRVVSYCSGACKTRKACRDFEILNVAWRHLNTFLHLHLENSWYLSRARTKGFPFWSILSNVMLFNWPDEEKAKICHRGASLSFMHDEDPYLKSFWIIGPYSWFQVARLGYFLLHRGGCRPCRRIGVLSVHHLDSRQLSLGYCFPNVFINNFRCQNQWYLLISIYAYDCVSMFILTWVYSLLEWSY